MPRNTYLHLVGFGKGGATQVKGVGGGRTKKGGYNPPNIYVHFPTRDSRGPWLRACELGLNIVDSN